MDTKKQSLLNSHLIASLSTTSSNNYPVFTPDLSEQNSSTLDILYKTALEGITDTLELSDKENSPSKAFTSKNIPHKIDHNQTEFFDVNSSQETFVISKHDRKKDFNQESTLKLAIKSLEQELSYYKFENENLNKELAIERAKLAKETENLLLANQENALINKLLDEKIKKLQEYENQEQNISTPVGAIDKKVKFNAVDLTPEIINKNFPVNTPVKKGRRLVHEQTPGPGKGLLKKSCLNAHQNNNDKYQFDKNQVICLSEELKENSYDEINDNTYEEIDKSTKEDGRSKWNKNVGDSLTLEMEEANEAIKMLKNKLNQKSPSKSSNPTPENTKLKESLASNITHNQSISQTLSQTASTFTNFMNNLTPSTDDNLHKRNKIKPNLINCPEHHIKKLQFSIDQQISDSDVDKSTFRENLIKSPKIEDLKIHNDSNFDPKMDFDLKIDPNFENNLIVPEPEPIAEPENLISKDDRLKRISIANQSSMEKDRLEKVKEKFIQKLDKKRLNDQYASLPKSSSHNFEKPKVDDILKSKTCQNLNINCVDSPEVINPNGRKSKFGKNNILSSKSNVCEKNRPFTVAGDRINNNFGRKGKCIKQSSSTLSLKQEMVEARRQKGRKILNEERERIENTLNPGPKVVKSFSTSKLAKSKYNNSKLVHTSHDNKQQIILAIENTCLPGVVNAKERKLIIEPIHSLVNNVEYHLVVLFRNERFQFRGVYRLDQNHKDDSLVKSDSNLSINSISSDTQLVTFLKVSGKGPDKITDSNIKTYYSYYTGRKIFSPINGKTFGFNVAGMTIDESFWKRKNFKKKIKNEV